MSDISPKYARGGHLQLYRRQTNLRFENIHIGLIFSRPLQPKEDRMASLKSLNIVALPKISSNPTLDRRARVTAKQLLSDSPAKKYPSNPNSALCRGGQCSRMGPTSFSDQVGNQLNSRKVKLPSLEKLPSVIETLIDAVRNGELDEQLAQASKQARPPGSKSKQAG